MSVASPLAVADLLTDMIGPATGPRIAAVFADSQGKPLSAVHREGEVGCAEVMTVCDIATDDDDTAEPELLILATWRPGSDAEPDEYDEGCWRSLLEQLDGRPLHLVDWLLIDGDLASSMATRFGRLPSG
jgi:hypothetical protein